MGIRMHRFIDAFTDHHPVAIDVRKVFIGPVRRFAGIVTDVLFDHYLARDWDRYSNTPILEHIDQVHAALEEHHDSLPAGLQRFAQFIKREAVLEANLSFAGVEATLERLSWRSERFSTLASAAPIAQAHEPELLAAFQQLFPELVVAVDAHREALIR